MSLQGKNNEEKIWNYLLPRMNNNKFGVAGLMGNLQAESGLEPTNLQNSYNTKFGMNDAQYTAAVDNGTYTNFNTDSAGYGLAQWTYWSRKQNLYNFIKGKNKSIGDLEGQLDFLYQELTTGYNSVWNILLNATSVKQASDVVLTQYEKPANQNDAVKKLRCDYGTAIYNRNAGSAPAPAPTPTPQPSKYTNSSLVSYTCLSPNYSTRTQPITKITPHHMAGNLTVESCGNIFKQPSRKASSNYGIGTDGRIALYVEEKNRAWTSGNADNDQSAVTMEVANCKGAPNWEISDAAWNSLVNLCVDICQRNGIKSLSWTGGKDGSLTCHYMFQATACPGPYMKGRMAELANVVNSKLSGGVAPAPQPAPIPAPQPDPATGFPYLVRVTCDTLNVRKGPSTAYVVTTTVHKGEVYTIVDAANNFGKLKSGAGYICLSYTERV